MRPLILLGALLAVSHADPAQPAPDSTCIARTVNYITHRLPQQCLTSFSAYPTPAATLHDSATPTAAHVPEQTATTTTTTTTTTGVDVASEVDEDDGSDLSTGAFMSFEEWKAMMLAKDEENSEPRHRRVPESRGEASNGDFASLGDEGEIDLDFDAYSDRISDFTSSSATRGTRDDRREDQPEKITYEEGLALVHRSKDAGKTCKERFSYSSFDAGATVLKTSPGTKNPSAILLENKDSYMLLECATENKFFIVELSDDILVDTIVLANYEFFSSMIREFRVSVSDRYPVKAEKWKTLGTFQARNARDIQPFLVEHPQDWARYLRVEILSHWGNEFYCPLSLLRVHGTRMMDAWKELDAADIDADDEPTKPLAIEDSKNAEEAGNTSEAAPEETVEVVQLEQEADSEPIPEAPPEPVPEKLMAAERAESIATWNAKYLGLVRSEPTCPAVDATLHISEAYAGSSNQTVSTRTSPTASVSSSQPIHAVSNTSLTAQASKSILEPSSLSVYLSYVTSTSLSESTIQQTNGRTMEENRTTSKPQETSPQSQATTGHGSSASITATDKSMQNPQGSPSKTSTPWLAASKTSASRVQSVKPGSTPAPSTTQRSKASSTSGPPAASPTVQDSFFKALTKRLQVLESNTTLSLQYIESQSRFLQEALAKLEKRQVSKVDQFLNTLNNTVLNELREVRTQYDQIWQSTVIALETQREQAEREIVALGSRVGVLADEVVFQKRMAIVQSILLLICLVLVIFSRGLSGNAVGLISAESSYYPGQFFASASRNGSPIFHRTPKSAYKNSNNMMHDSPGGTETPMSNRTNNDGSARNSGALRPMSNNAQQAGQTLMRRRTSQQSHADMDIGDADMSPHHQAAGQQHAERYRQPPALRTVPLLSRAVSASVATTSMDYFAEQLPTPTSSVGGGMGKEDGRPHENEGQQQHEQEEDMGYDSEPNMTPSMRERLSRKDDGSSYFSAANNHNNTNGNGTVNDGGLHRQDGDLDDRNVLVHAGHTAYTNNNNNNSGRGRSMAAERQLTPPLGDGMFDDESAPPQVTERRPALFHTSSTRKPLPALPEDPD